VKIVSVYLVIFYPTIFIFLTIWGKSGYKRSPSVEFYEYMYWESLLYLKV